MKLSHDTGGVKTLVSAPCGVLRYLGRGVVLVVRVVRVVLVTLVLVADISGIYAGF